MKYWLGITLSILILITVSCSQEELTDQEPPQEPETEQGEDAGQIHEGPVMKYIDETEAERIEGDNETQMVWPGDYAQAAEAFEVSGATIKMAHDNDYIYLYLEAESDGWVSVGFNRVGGGMNGATMIIGNIEIDGLPTVREDVGQGHRHSEVAEPVLENYSTSASNGRVELEFAYPMNFAPDQGFSLDGLARGESYSLIYATNTGSADINRSHNMRGAITFTVE